MRTSEKGRRRAANNLRRPAKLLAQVGLGILDIGLVSGRRLLHPGRRMKATGLGTAKVAVLSFLTFSSDAVAIAAQSFQLRDDWYHHPLGLKCLRHAGNSRVRLASRRGLRPENQL